MSEAPMTPSDPTPAKKLADMTTDEISDYTAAASSMVELALPDGMPFFLMLMDINEAGRITKGRSISMHMTQDQITQMFERGARSAVHRQGLRDTHGQPEASAKGEPR